MSLNGGFLIFNSQNCPQIVVHAQKYTHEGNAPFLILSSILPPATDCMLSEWSEWSECNKSCGKGHMIRSRMVKLEPQFGGMPCPETVQRKKCKIRKCTKGLRTSEKRKRQEASDRRRAKPSRESVAEESSGPALFSIYLLQV